MNMTCILPRSLFLDDCDCCSCSVPYSRKLRAQQWCKAAWLGYLAVLHAYDMPRLQLRLELQGYLNPSSHEKSHPSSYTPKSLILPDILHQTHPE